MRNGRVSEFQKLPLKFTYVEDAASGGYYEVRDATPGHNNDILVQVDYSGWPTYYGSPYNVQNSFLDYPSLKGWKLIEVGKPTSSGKSTATASAGAATADPWIA